MGFYFHFEYTPSLSGAWAGTVAASVARPHRAITTGDRATIDTVDTRGNVKAHSLGRPIFANEALID